jgi:hypothetical protein
MQCMKNLSRFSKDLFTDRHELTRLFAEYLNDDQPPNKILYFHGSGGSGKTWLLNFLRDNCCKKFSKDTWQQIKAKPDADLADYIRIATHEYCIPVPGVLLDFSVQKAFENDNLQNGFYGPLMLRRNLAKAAKELNYTLRFPLYDFACVWYLYKKDKLSKEKLKELFPHEEIDFLVEIYTLFSGNSIFSTGKAVLKLFNKHLGEKFILYLQQRQLTNKDVQDIQNLDVDKELISELPRLLAQDLNAAMSQQQAPKTIVLFFDAHDKCWDQNAIHFAGDLFFQKDEWLGRLLWALLELKAPIMVVVAGRDELRWAGATQTQVPISMQYLHTQLVKDFSPDDAIDYLHRVEGLDENLRNAFMDKNLCNALIEFASVKDKQVHPFFLSLCVDLVREGKCRTSKDFSDLPLDEPKLKVLRERLLNNVKTEIRDAVEALSAALDFDYKIFKMLGEKLGLQLTRTYFDDLTRFSFVEQLDKDRYRIHDLLSRLDYESGNERTRQAHEVLAQYYWDNKNLPYVIYHYECSGKGRILNNLMSLVLPISNRNDSEKITANSNIFEYKKSYKSYAKEMIYNK